MSFLSLSYFLFFPAAAAGYFLAPKRGKNVWLLACSWFFYLCAGAEYFVFLLSTVLVSYFGAKGLEKGRKGWLLGLLLGLFIAALGVFKYLGFAVATVKQALALVGLDWSVNVPRLLLPAGISFYFFAAMGYLIDVYRGKLPAERSFVKCALFLSFFPALLSGPIGRAGELLPQFDRLHKFNYVTLREGCARFLWGAFKKLVIADKLAVVVNTVFAAPGSFGAVQVILAACAFSIQIYCDFSAYTDMALASARVMGFTLAENFRTPYFAKSIAEFWRRWHISLSTWFRDYLYIPLGGSRRGRVRTYGNILIVFAVSGLWHGAALTFVAWGLLNGLYQVVSKLLQPLREGLLSLLRIPEDSRLLHGFRVVFTFFLTCLAWVLFRANSLSEALWIFRALFSIPVTGLHASLSGLGVSFPALVMLGAFTLLLFIVDWLIHQKGLPEKINRTVALRYAVYFMLLAALLIFGSYGDGYDPQDFVYFQF